MTINAEFFNQVARQAAACQSCEELQRVKALYAPQLQKALDAIAAQQAALAAAQSLLTLNPSDLPGVISFLGTLKSQVIAPLLAPYAQYLLQATETAAAVTGALSAISDASGRFPNCSIV